MTITIEADGQAPGTPLEHFWKVCVGAGRANEALRAGWQEHLRTAVDACGFSYVRFYGLFHDDMFVYREENGRPVYNFTYVNEVLDRLLDAGVRPFVQLGFCPRDLARERGTVFWWQANGSPPVDLGRWSELVRRTVANAVERYGLDEVRTWYFEVWNEPNLRPFFRGTRREYLELYAASARAVKSVDSQLRVGGPATSNFVPDARFETEDEDASQHTAVTEVDDLDTLNWQPVWLAWFLEACRRDNLPVDFVSCHPYPTDWALDEQGETRRYTRGADATRTDLTVLRQMINDGPFPQAEIHLTEWNSSPSSRDHTHDHLQAATFVVKANVESAGLVDSLSYWTFTDVFEEEGAGDTSFHGGFGLLNYQGIPKPTFHAYRFLHRLGDEVLTRAPGSIVTRHRDSGRITALAYHYPPEVRQAPPASMPTREVAEETLRQGSATALQIELTGLPPGTSMIVETLDGGHGNALALWDELGRPEPLSRQQAADLRQQAGATRRQLARADDGGRLSVQGQIQPWGVVLIDQQ